MSDDESTHDAIFTMPLNHRTESQDLRRIKLQHEMNIETERIKNTWNTFCLKMDRRAVQYFCQVIIIASTMAFSAAQLIRLPDCDAQQAYLGLLTLLVVLLLPNPKFHEKDRPTILEVE